MLRPVVLLAVGAVAAALVVAGGTAFWFSRPTRLTVAISRGDADDTALVEAAANLLRVGRHSVRLHIVPVDGPAAAVAAVDDGSSDLAVIRTDVTLPDHAETVVILHRDAALLLAPQSGAVHAIGDLAGRTVGVVHNGAGNEHLLETTLAQYDVGRGTVKTVALDPEGVADAIASHTVDAVLAVGVVSSQRVRGIVEAVEKAGGGDPVFIPVPEAEAIAQRSPAYEKLQVVRGAFGGATPLPDDDYDTISITHRLVANDTVSQDLVSDLTQFLLSDKFQLASTAPVAQQIEAPSTDKGAGLPVHAGSAAYIDDNEETFFDKYSDMIYMGAMLLGVLASGATAVMGRISSRRVASIEASVARLIEMLADVRRAGSQAALDALQNETDAIMGASLGSVASIASDERHLAAFGIVLEQVRAAVRDRREQLVGGFGGIARTAAE